MSIPERKYLQRQDVQCKNINYLFVAGCALEQPEFAIVRVDLDTAEFGCVVNLLGESLYTYIVH